MLRLPLIGREEAPLTLPARINIEKNLISSSTSSSHRSSRVQETHFLNHLFLINVTITISFVPFHISCRTSSHSYCHSAHLSFGLIIFTRSGCIRKCIFSRKKNYFLVCSALSREYTSRQVLARTFQTAAPTTSCAIRPCNVSIH